MKAPYGFAMLTLTVASAAPASGFKVLGQARARFWRARPAHAAMVGGEGHVQFEPSGGGDGDMWNVHLHAIVELGRPLRNVDVNQLEELWGEGLARFGATGRLRLNQASNLKADYFADGHR